MKSECKPLHNQKHPHGDFERERPRAPCRSSVVSSRFLSIAPAAQSVGSRHDAMAELPSPTGVAAPLPKVSEADTCSTAAEQWKAKMELEPAPQAWELNEKAGEVNRLLMNVVQSRLGSQSNTPQPANFIDEELAAMKAFASIVTANGKMDMRSSQGKHVLQGRQGEPAAPSGIQGMQDPC